LSSRVETGSGSHRLLFGTEEPEESLSRSVVAASLPEVNPDRCGWCRIVAGPKLTTGGVLPSESEENYLRALWKLSGEPEDWVPTGKLADRVGVSHPSATRMAGRLSEQGWVEHEPYRGVRLTPGGRELALQMVRRHRILETYISKILGVPWDQVDAEVERLEHAVSDDLICRMEEALGFPARDPHGSPIPDRDGCLPITSEEIILTEAPITEDLEVVRVIDLGPEVLQWLGERGVTPGSIISIEAREPGGGPLLLNSKEIDRPIALGGALASSILVRSIDL